MASAAGKEPPSSVDTDAGGAPQKSAPSDTQQPSTSATVSAVVAAAEAARGAGRQSLVPTQDGGALANIVDLELEDDFELPSVLRPDTTAAPRRPGPRLTLSQLSPVRPLRDRPPTLVAVPSLVAEVAPRSERPSLEATTAPAVNGRDDAVAPAVVSQAAPTAREANRPAATSDPTVAVTANANAGPEAKLPAIADVAGDTEHRATTTAPVETAALVPPVGAPVSESQPVETPTPAVVKDVAPPANVAPPKPISMPFMDTRMRRLAEFSSKPQVEAAPIVTASVPSAPPAQPSPDAAAQSIADAMPAHALDPFSALPTFERATAESGPIMPPPLPPTAPVATPATTLDPLAYADDIPADVFGGVDAAAADLMRPLLREWLSENMPRIVEKALRIEVARASAPPPPKPKT